jgi:hypothetical protein
MHSGSMRPNSSFDTEPRCFRALRASASRSPVNSNLRAQETAGAHLWKKLPYRTCILELHSLLGSIIVEYESRAFRVRSIIQPRPGFAWGVRVWDPEPDDVSQLAQLTRRVLQCARTVLREGQHGASPACVVLEPEREHLREHPEGQDVLALLSAVTELVSSRGAAP